MVSNPRRGRGTLEAAIMDVLWRASRPLTGRQVRDAIASNGDLLALTTVLTVLGRMAEKGRLERVPHARGAVFRALSSETESAATAMAAALCTVSDRDGVLQRFAGALSAEDISALRSALSRWPDVSDSGTFSENA